MFSFLKGMVSYIRTIIKWTIQSRWSPIHKQDGFVSGRHTQHSTNQSGPPPGHLPCFRPFSEEPEILDQHKCIRFEQKNSANRQEVTQPGILVISKFFDHTMKRFSLGSVGLKGAVDWPCIPVQMSCMDFEPTLLPFVCRIITPILGFIEGIAPSRKSCLLTHLTKI